MDPSQPIPPRRRLQALLAIPDSQRTEAEWDELNELEIKLAPGNRDDTGGSRDDVPPKTGGRSMHGGLPPRPEGGGGGGGGPGGGPGGGGGARRKPARKFHKRPPKTNLP